METCKKSKYTPVTLTCAIIGAGFSGTSLVANLIKQEKTHLFLSPLKILLIEKNKFAQGIAYSTKSPSHILNIRAKQMGAFFDDQNHFVRWARKKDKHLSSNSYVPRMFYAEYLHEILLEAEKNQSKRCSIERLLGEIVSIHPSNNKFELNFKNNTKIQADFVVLATGNYLSPHPPVTDKRFINHPDYYRNPYQQIYPNNSDILIIGTGLSMVDQVLHLASVGYKGKIHALSRRGHLPLSWKKNKIPFRKLSQKKLAVFTSLHTTLKWFRFIRKKIKEEDFETILHVYGYLLKNIETFDRKEFKRCERHCSRYLRRIIHQIPYESYSILQDLIANQKLLIHAGKLLKIDGSSHEFKVFFQPQYKRETEVLKVGKIINCMNLGISFTEIQDPLLNSLFNKGIIRPNSSNLILDTSDIYQIVNSAGKEIEGMFAIGAVNKTKLSTARSVPIIRKESYSLAEIILSKAFSKLFTR